MKTASEVQDWVASQALTPSDVDCAVTVMLKILDGKCKMRPTEKQVMTHLYHAVCELPGIQLGADIHRLIAQAGAQPDDSMKLAIYEKRVLAETMISRPVMKAFKSMIREQGLLDPRHDAEEADA